MAKLWFEEADKHVLADALCESMVAHGDWPALALEAPDYRDRAVELVKQSLSGPPDITLIVQVSMVNALLPEHEEPDVPRVFRDAFEEDGAP